MSELEGHTIEEIERLAAAAEAEAQEARDKSMSAETAAGKWMLENEADIKEAKANYWRAEVSRREVEAEYSEAKTKVEREFLSAMVECWSVMVEYHLTQSSFLAALAAYMRAEAEGKAEAIAEAWEEVLKWKAQVEDWSAQVGSCRTKAEISRCDWAIEYEKWATKNISFVKRVSLP